MVKVGFLVWNEFQFFHIKGVLRDHPDVALIIEQRSRLRLRFPRIVTRGLENPIRIVRPSNLDTLGSMVDVLVVQSKTGAAKHMPPDRIVGLQYSLSKEWHQYGPWLTTAGLVLSFGEYSRQRISTSSPVVPIGNPRLDDYFAGRLDAGILGRMAGQLDPSKKTILLAPSWQDGKSIAALKASLRQLRAQFNVFWMPHHNTRIFSRSMPYWVSRFTTGYDKFLYCLMLSDLLVSDTSGALFDAIHVGKPVVVADFFPSERDGGAQGTSIEFARRDQIGPVASNIDELHSLIGAVLDGRVSFETENAALRRECLIAPGGASNRIMRAIHEHYATPR